ncbi:probable tRNA (uracil-O(2)-)-methyltransferase [Agrilus planipennis]|uniref:tRNA (uracil-O(2)-)-methyltransferase n=1 Tax=Agrilus planipennis TaxID=224129 RepID=A0A1W4XCV2_AGRPL|nr:probable tRNA (uracil-O(2)-)-methyltransferase [Agrilus planipennis]
MLRLPLVTNDEFVSVDQFWSALLLYHERPHIANRRIIGASQIFFMKVQFKSKCVKRITELFTFSALIYEIRKMEKLSKEYVKPDFIKSILEPYDKKCELKESSVDEFLNCQNGTFISVRILLPRQNNYKQNVEVVVFDKNENLNVVTFFSVAERNEKIAAPVFPYDIEFLPPGIINVCVDCIEYAETVSADWLVGVLFPKLMKWAKESAFKLDVKNSLSLVNIDLYSNLYHSLKEKYGKQIVQMWPEKTDPYKYVYEDIAIASYLIALWTKYDPDHKPSFVDLGCGNGLLVHILNEEGFEGYGVDVRSRKIWSFYPDTTKLKVQALTPSADSLFPQTDWIIGNHSDELTPWIPVITARSSYNAKFFLLPCCSYEFDGKKFQRKNTSKSQYADYLDYIEGVSKICGLIVAKDRLRIPSTKRTCLVSYKRCYKPEMFPEIDNNISKVIKEKIDCKNVNETSERWIENYETRPETEKVRNCTKIDKDIVQSILKQISIELLKEEDFLIKSDGSKWNRGKKESFPNLAKRISPEYLKELKKQCGGLQTLIKNNKYLFLIENGFVQFRVPPFFDINNGKHKSKYCWFHENHPHGCYYNDSSCSYKH